MYKDSIIKKTIETNLSGSERDILAKFTTYNIVRSLDLSQSIIKEFHKNILMQALLSDEEKKVLSFFFNISLEQNLKLLAAMAKGNEIDIDLLYAAYIDVLHERAITGSSSFLEKVYFPQRINWLLQDKSFMLETEYFVSDCFEKRPMAKNNLKHIWKNKKFYDTSVATYIQKHKNMADEALHVHRKEVLARQMAINPSEWLIVSFFADQAIHLSNPVTHNIVSKDFFYLEIEQAIRSSHNQRLKIKQEQEEKQRKAVQKEKNSRPQKHTQKKELPVDQAKPLTSKQEALLDQLEKKMIDKVTIDIRYIRRMLKKWWPIYIESLIQDLGEGYSDTLLEEIVSILWEFDVEIVTKKDEEIQEIVKQTEKTHLPKETNQESIVVSQTLENIKNTPEKLTTDILVQIFEELGYRFFDKKVFYRDSALLGLDKEGNTGLITKKKIIELLKMPPDVSREHRKSHRWCPNYQRRDLKRGARIVKQWNTIVWIVNNRDEYRNRVNKYFVSDKIDFDLMLTSRKEWDIDPRCV